MEIYIPEDLKVKDLQKMVSKLIYENPKAKIQFNVNASVLIIVEE